MENFIFLYSVIWYFWYYGLLYTWLLKQILLKQTGLPGQILLGERDLLE